jgi:subtilase family serine protease
MTLKLRSAGSIAGSVLSVFLVTGATALADPPPSPGHSGEHHQAICPAAAKPGIARCHADVVTDAAGKPYAGSGPGGGYVASDLQSAYKLDGAAGPSATNGAGNTIAIVDAYDDPTAFADLQTYRSATGLPPISDCPVSGATTPCFQKVNQSGGSTPPAVNASWAQEIALDVEMASAICPKCNILLVEANSAYLTDLGTAVDRAATMGATTISNSYGGNEFFGETSYDHFYSHGSTPITVSSGDSGYGAEYPATSPGVIAVGGTTLNAASNTRGWNETAWSGAGSGCSGVEPKQSWQLSPAIDTRCSGREEADVSAVANPNTGVSVYDSTPYAGQSGWMVFGGTSVAAPIVASVYTLAGGNATPSALYAKRSSLFDVTTGSNGRCRKDPLVCTAGTGWDGPTGLGTPNGIAAFQP